MAKVGKIINPNQFAHHVTIVFPDGEAFQVSKTELKDREGGGLQIPPDANIGWVSSTPMSEKGSKDEIEVSVPNSVLKKLEERRQKMTEPAKAAAA